MPFGKSNGNACFFATYFWDGKQSGYRHFIILNTIFKKLTSRAKKKKNFDVGYV